MKPSRPWLMFVVLSALSAGASGAPSIDQLTDQLDSDDWLLQAEAAVLLADVRPQQARPILRSLVGDDDRRPWLRGRALRSLAKVDPEAAGGAARRLIRADSADLRRDAAAVLGRVGGDRSRAAVESALDDADPAVRAAAVAALVRLDPADAWSMLEAALSRADERTLPILAGVAPLVDRSAARQLTDDLLRHDDPAVRRSVILGLADQGDESALRRLMAAAGGESNPANRRRALRSLADQPAETLDHLIRLGLRSDSEAQVRGAMALLRQQDRGQLAEPVAAALPRLEAAGRLADGLAFLTAHQPGRHLRTIRRYLTHDDQAIRLLAAEGIAAIDGVDRWAELAGRLDDGEAVRERVVELLLEAEPPERGVMAHIGDPLAGNANRWRDVSRLMGRFLTEDELPEAARKLKPWLESGNRGRRESAFEALDGVVEPSNAWQVAATLGYLYDWRIIGPFPNDKSNSGHNRVYPPEKRIDLDGAYAGDDDRQVAWQRYRLTRIDGKVVMHELMPLPSHYRVAYAHTVIDAPRAMKARLRTDADDSIKVWLNGQLVIDHAKGGGRNADVDLQAGPNRVLVKIANKKDFWAFRVELTDRDDKSVDWLLRQGVGG